MAEQQQQQQSSLEEIASLMKDHLLKLLENWELKTIVIRNSAVEGRGLFAAKDLFPGDLIFVDSPLIYGPRNSINVKIGCISCHNPNKKTYNCPYGCNLPVCSEDCQNSSQHKNECDLITSWKCLQEIEDPQMFAKSIVPLRILLLNDSEKKFFKSLAVHDSPHHGSEVRYIKKHFEITKEEEDLMMRACLALDANAYEMIKSIEGCENINLRGLFPVSALLNHSCLPNTRTSFDCDGNMRVMASAYIPEGSEIFTSYTGLLWSTTVRRHHLKKTKHFSCDCSRCCDKTEHGTKLAALKCLNRFCSGIMLPEDPLEFASFWTCDSCDIRVLSVQVGTLQSAIARLIGSVQLETFDDIDQFIKSHLMKFLPESNHIVVELKCRLIWLLGDEEKCGWNSSSVQLLTRGEELCRELLETCKLLNLEETPLCARLHLQLHHCLLEKLRRLRHNDAQTDLQNVSNLEKEVVYNLRKSYDILKGDISAPRDLEKRHALLKNGVDALLGYAISDNCSDKIKDNNDNVINKCTH